MGKFGKKVVVDVDMSKYIIGLLAPSGFGKSTLLSKAAEKEFGTDGYIALDMGQEDGYATISGAVVEKCADFTHFKEVIDDIVVNKTTEYPNLKLCIIDTLDAAYEIAEKYTIKSYNREHMNDKDFKKAMSINSVEGGFGRGLDRCIDTFKEQLAKLKSVGVGFWYAGHCKEKEITDAITQTSITQLTTSMTQKYFNSIKDISHVIGFGYYDRSFEHQEGKENPITKKKKERDVITEETRRIKFRDDGYLMDAKSRFPEIVPEIDLNAEQFINAIKNAIKAASDKKVMEKAVSATTAQPPKKIIKTVEEAPEVIDTEEEVVEEIVEKVEDDIPPFDTEEAPNKTVLINDIRVKFGKADIDLKKQIKKILIEKGDGTLSEDLDVKVLEDINSLL